MIQTDKGIYELAKMAVARQFQGLGIGKKLIRDVLIFLKKERLQKFF
jgi:predicted N-acetyltransferase YhbS